MWVVRNSLHQVKFCIRIHSNWISFYRIDNIIHTHIALKLDMKNVIGCNFNRKYWEELNFRGKWVIYFCSFFFFLNVKCNQVVHLCMPFSCLCVFDLIFIISWVHWCSCFANIEKNMKTKIELNKQTKCSLLMIHAK